MDYILNYLNDQSNLTLNENFEDLKFLRKIEIEKTVYVLILVRKIQRSLGNKIVKLKPCQNTDLEPQGKFQKGHGFLSLCHQKGLVAVA